MKRRFEDKGPNFLFLGAAVLVFFAMLWLSCHQQRLVDAFTETPAQTASPAPAADVPAP